MFTVGITAGGYVFKWRPWKTVWKGERDRAFLERAQGSAPAALSVRSLKDPWPFNYRSDVIMAAGAICPLFLDFLQRHAESSSLFSSTVPLLSLNTHNWLC